MRKSIPILIEVEGNNCGRDCIFLDDDQCLLFKQPLEETELPDDLTWADDAEPTRQRFYKCLYIG